LSSQWIISLYTDRHGVLWIGTVEGGLNRFDPEKRQFINYRHDPKHPESLGSDVVISMHEDSEGYLWVGTDGGVDRFDRARSQFHHYRYDPVNPESIGEGGVAAICEDRSGLVWFATDKGGVYSYNPAKASFLHYARNPTDQGSLSHDDVSALCEDRAGGLWVGTNGGGLNYLPAGAMAFQHFKYDPGDPASVSSNYITSVCEQRNGEVWIGTRDGRLDRYDRKRGAFVHYAYKRGDIPSNHSNTVNTIYEDRGGNLWVGDAFGLARVDVRKNTFVHQKLLQGNTVLSIYEDADGNSWTGTWRTGLYRFDRTKNNLASYRHDPESESSLSDNTVWCITQDESGHLWAGTGRGLDFYDPSLDGFKHYTEKDGLCGTVVYGILVDSKGNLWLSTDKGLSEFSPDSKSFRNYGAGDGLHDVRFNEGGFWKGKRGQMFFGSETGVYAFFPDDVQYETRFPAVVLTSFNVFDRPLQLDRAISAMTEVSLTHQDNFISIGYAAPDYAAPGRTQFVYMLESQDKDWVSAGTVHSASYQYLEPGDYVFRVKASNTPGLWEENSTSIKIAITPPYWSRWWFQVASAALFVGFLGVLYRRRIADLTRAEVAHKEFLTKLIETQEVERKRIASDLHDGLGQGLLVVNSGLQEYLRQNGGAKAELERVSSLVQESINEVREIASDLHPHHLERLGLRVALEMIVDRMSHSSNVLFHFTSDEIDDLFTKNEQIILYRIVQEAVSNIVRHSGATNATIAIQKRGGELRLTVLDDGKGFSVRQHEKRISSTRDLKNLGYGFGLLTMTERARLIGGSLVIESGPGEGTKLAFHIPLIDRDAKKIVKGRDSIFP